MTLMPHATVMTGNIADNWRTLDALHPGTTTAAVVKADAYGLGAARVARSLRIAGCQTFFVAYAEEALVVRKAAGKAARIFVLNGPVRGEMALYRDADLTAVLSSEAHAKLWANAPKGSCALHFDTGMNRLGLPADMTEKDLADLRRLQPVLVMSHLVSADEPDNPVNAAQRKAFNEIADAFPDTPASLANSSGCYLGKGFAYDLTRPGLALYGGTEPPEKVKLKPGVMLEATILATFKGRAGTQVGYGGAYTLSEDRMLATVGLGYADGIPRAGANRLTGWLQGNPCPVLGRVSMDMMTLDVTDCAKHAKPGARVEFLGENAKLEAQAAACGTLGYELLTGLGPRVQRVYR
ncbi:alanine racemase [Hyphomonas sp. WL0036]|uniref:alanine racemase n=1 Tax=Hyphomonas sediminis TaxID=2866160 RepID=UPI001C7FEF3F|nr:alanine racemase [Hyphomonas sediminis]MBY9065309.1 alanine racemase [Hyphomonas sediminis]